MSAGGEGSVAVVRKSLDCFMEPIDYSLDACVPDPVSFVTKLEQTLLAHDEFVVTPEQQSIAREIIHIVGEYERLNGAKNMSRQLESEQEREQEQEQQREVQAKRDQQIEVEKFVEREYSRADETPHPWPLSILAQSLPNPAEANSTKRDRDTIEDHPFQELRKFRLRHQEPLEFPGYLLSSRNYFNPAWQGLRRVKNVVMVMEWTPSVSAIAPMSPEEHRASAEKIHKGSSKIALEKAYRLLSARTGSMTREDAFNAIRAATDQKVSNEELDEIMATYGKEGSISLTGFSDLLTSGRLHGIDLGRYFVALSLAEAETIRRALHIRASKKKPFIASGSQDCAVALRYTPFATFGGAATSTDSTATQKPSKESDEQSSFQRTVDGGIVFDASDLWREGTNARTHVPTYQLSEAHNCMRFLDCSMHFTEPALNVLVRALQRNSVHARERFFYTTIGSRRRLERKWQDTPLAKVFTVPDEWFALKQRAQAVFTREAIRSKKLTLWEAFMAFDSDDNGVLSPAEFYGAVKWLGIPDLTPHDVVDMIEAADRNRDGFIDYKEYMYMLRDPDATHAEQDEEQHAETKGEDKTESDETVSPTLRHIVEPYGADILREVMVQRKREELARQREDRMRQALFQQTLDIRVFEEELRASRKRKGGPNPRLLDIPDESGSTSTKCAIFSFTTNQRPLRMVAHGTCRFIALNADSLMAAAAHGRITMPCEKGHELTRANRYGLCNVCKTQGTQFYCNKGCSFAVCSKCHERYSEEKKRSMADLSDKHTYLECVNGSSFTLQIPASLSSSSSVEPSTDIATVTDEAAEPVTAPLKVECAQFTVTMEIRVERLPPRGQLGALMRFAPPGVGRSRQKNQASVYFDENGTVGNSKTIPFPIVNGGNLSEVELAELEGKKSSPKTGPLPPNCPGLHTMRWFMANSNYSCDRCEFQVKQEEFCMRGCQICNFNICKNCCDAYYKFQEENPESNKLGWRILSLVVDADKGVLTSYVNGKINSIVDSLSREDLLLQHQIVVFGGSKQGHLRGGAIRKLEIHNKCLSEDVIASIHEQLTKDREILVVWCNLSQNRLHESIQRHFIHDAGLKLIVCSNEAEALETIKKESRRIQCVIVTLCGTKLTEEELDAQAMAGGQPLDSTAGSAATANKEPEGLTPEEKQKLLTPGYQLCLDIRKVLPMVPILLDCTMPPPKKRVLIVGERVQALFKSGKRWYPGEVTKVYEAEDVYDILYADGDKESKVPMQNIKPEHSVKSVPITLTPTQQTECLEKYNVNPLSTLEKLEDSVSLACLISSHRHQVAEAE